MFTFGIAPPEGKHPKYWWGARAIFTHGCEVNHGMWGKKNAPKYIFTTEVALLPDRQTFSGPQDDGDKKFTHWINNVGLPAVRKWAEKVQTDSRDVFNFKDKEYHITATPNGSYGYMHIGAWSLEEKEVGV
jgi:hypothetical protein